MDYIVNIKANLVPPAKYTYRMSRDQAKVIKEYINNILRKGYIRLSTSLYTASVLIIKKLDGGLRVCIDYRALNALTVQN